jgi:hypothetical protein
MEAAETCDGYIMPCRIVGNWSYCKYFINLFLGGPVHYFLNVDRCAYYWDDGATGNNIGGRKYIGGSRVFAVVNNCTMVYDLIENEDKWEKVENQRNHTCIFH